jgi:hypothetical protein
VLESESEGRATWITGFGPIKGGIDFDLELELEPDVGVGVGVSARFDMGRSGYLDISTAALCKPRAKVRIVEKTSSTCESGFSAK